VTVDKPLSCTEDLKESCVDSEDKTCAAPVDESGVDCKDDDTNPYGKCCITQEFIDPGYAEILRGNVIVDASFNYAFYDNSSDETDAMKTALETWLSTACTSAVGSACRLHHLRLDKGWSPRSTALTFLARTVSKKVMIGMTDKLWEEMMKTVFSAGGASKVMSVDIHWDEEGEMMKNSADVEDNRVEDTCSKLGGRCMVTPTCAAPSAGLCSNASCCLPELIKGLPLQHTMEISLTLSATFSVELYEPWSDAAQALASSIHTWVTAALSPWIPVTASIHIFHISYSNVEGTEINFIAHVFNHIGFNVTDLATIKTVLSSQAFTGQVIVDNSVQAFWHHMAEGDAGCHMMNGTCVRTDDEDVHCTKGLDKWCSQHRTCCLPSHHYIVEGRCSHLRLDLMLGGEYVEALDDKTSNVTKLLTGHIQDWVTEMSQEALGSYYPDIQVKLFYMSLEYQTGGVHIWLVLNLDQAVYRKALNHVYHHLMDTAKEFAAEHFHIMSVQGRCVLFPWHTHDCTTFSGDCQAACTGGDIIAVPGVCEDRQQCCISDHLKGAASSTYVAGYMRTLMHINESLYDPSSSEYVALHAYMSTLFSTACGSMTSSRTCTLVRLRVMNQENMAMVHFMLQASMAMTYTNVQELKNILKQHAYTGNIIFRRRSINVHQMLVGNNAEMVCHTALSGVCNSTCSDTSVSLDTFCSGTMHCCLNN
jgi:hypothetical protein